jgi:hypothetical protein
MAEHLALSWTGAPRRAHGLRRVSGGDDALRWNLRRQDPEGRQTGDLPVEQPTKFELVVNLKTAKRSGSRSPSRCCTGRTSSLNRRVEGLPNSALKSDGARARRRLTQRYAHRERSRGGGLQPSASPKGLAE